MKEIEKVQKIKEGIYQINDCIQISNLGIKENGDFYADIEYDDKQVSEEEAEKLVGKFVGKAIQDSLEEQEQYKEQE